jgi:hypothetical protein
MPAKPTAPWGSWSRLPRQSISLVQEALLKKKANSGTVDPGQVRRLIAELDDDEFRVRDKAARELANLGLAVRPALLKALQETTSAEVGYRLRGLLARLALPSSDELRAMRAVEVLERIGDAQARQALKVLTRGAPDEGVRKDAQAALKRLARRDR